MFLACEQEQSLNLQLSPEILSLQPSSTARQFVSSLGDTISLSLVNSEASVEEINEGGLIGNLNYELIKTERRWYQTQCDSPFFRFDYQFSCFPSSTSDQNQRDDLVLSFSDENGEKAESLSISYNGETFVLDPNLLIYYDSLNLINQVYYEVFSPLNGTEDFKQFYFTGQQGIVGFVSGDNVAFERIN